MQEKKRLEDAIMELRLQNEQLGGAGGGAMADEARPRSATTQTSPLSEESKAVMRELDTPEDSRHLARELTEAKQEVQRLTEEVGPQDTAALAHSLKSLDAMLYSFIQIAPATDAHGLNVARPCVAKHASGVGFRRPQPAGVPAVSEPGFGGRQHGSAAARGRRGS